MSSAVRHQGAVPPAVRLPLAALLLVGSAVLNPVPVGAQTSAAPTDASGQAAPALHGAHAGHHTAHPGHGSHDGHGADTNQGGHGEQGGDGGHRSHASAKSHGANSSPMHGAGAPPGARSPDYSNGVSAGPMTGMDMADDAPLAMIMIDHLEAFDGRHGSGQRWEAQGWYGNDKHKLWWRSEGERSGGKVDQADVEAFWSRPIAAFWNTQLGLRQDVGERGGRTWAAFGIQGLAPYWFDVALTGYVGGDGRLALRGKAEYEMRLTQRWILQPAGEFDLHTRDDIGRGLGRGLTKTTVGLRLRYEIRREIAPYVGIHLERHWGDTADRLRDAGLPVSDRQIVAGVRLWY